MLTQQKTACDAMLDEKNKLITEYQAVSGEDFMLLNTWIMIYEAHAVNTACLYYLYVAYYSLCHQAHGVFAGAEGKRRPVCKRFEEAGRRH